MTALFDDRLTRLAKQIDTKADKEALKRLQDQLASENRYLN